MTRKRIALVSHPHHFEITEIDEDLDSLQKLVGGYIEGVTDPYGEWVLYCNEEGKINGLPVNELSTLAVDAMWVQRGRAPFSESDVLVGPVVWLGPTSADGWSQSVSAGVVAMFVQVSLRVVTLRIRLAGGGARVTVIRDGNEIWVYDRHGMHVSAQINSLAVRAREREEHGTIEVWSGITKEKWVELRVELMDRPEITLHDQRLDQT